MLKYQVKTLGRDKKRQSCGGTSSIGLQDLFASSCRYQVAQENNVSKNSSPVNSFTTTTTSSLSQSPTQEEDEIDDQFSQQSSSISPSSFFRFTTDPRAKHFLKNRGRSTSVSSLSSTSTSSEPTVEWGTVRVYTSIVRPDTTYFTLFVSSAMTSDDLVRMALHRLRIRTKANDSQSQLYYLAMELSTHTLQSVVNNGAQQHQLPGEVKNVLVLEPDAKPLDLQGCHPPGQSKFVLHLRYTFPIKVYDYHLSPNSNYKSLLITQKTTCSDVIRNTLHYHKMDSFEESDLHGYVLVLVDFQAARERYLDHRASILEIAMQMNTDFQQIHIRSLMRRLVYNNFTTTVYNEPGQRKTFDSDAVAKRMTKNVQKCSIR